MIKEHVRGEVRGDKWIKGETRGDISIGRRREGEKF